MKLSYESIIDSSTNNFQKRHLILDKEMQLILLEMCNAILGDRENKCKYEAYIDDAFAIAVSAACGSFALDRLQQLARQGLYKMNAKSGCEFGYGSEFESGYESKFESGYESGYVSYYEKYSDKNTMIVGCDSSETVLLHIKQGKMRDLRFKIEKKSSLDLECKHLRWKDEKISHFKS